MSKRRILVVDDDPLWHRLIRRLFAGTDYDIYCAASCKDGVRLAELHSPDCILLDFHLADGNAVAVCAALKNGAARPRFPVIVVSSDPEEEVTAYAECGADYFILKGSHAMTELSRVVGDLLGSGRRNVLWDPGR